MKKEKFIICCLLMMLFACTEKKKPVIVENKEKIEILKDSPSNIVEPLKDKSVIELKNDTSETVSTTEEPEEDITAKDSINFDKYAVDVQEVFKKAPLDFSSYPDAKFFRTRIIDAYKSNEIAFGGHYIGTIFGCGASCIMGFIMDVRDGKIYDLPLGEKNMCSWDIDKAISNPDSRLFISAICKEDENSKTANYNAYVWNEEKKVFETVAQKEFIIKK
ncbi:hypothetical protein EZJ43_13305 [Pedobacter changchengzhani]|uniref:Lipoprotein n=1 Tax=Pedobacter changchengzhani TaxID=2529274 RepID=A0A4V2ZZZ5_9SPHI|nr:hypothetical protein [Pedobacter changchengzhani]TDG35593.1 hypothetical protein EZJ43_13305 [Pedobacter changchengzhani]